MELNREEIIKALECCAGIPNCNDCPLRPYPLNCKDVMKKRALAIIKAQDQRIFELENHLKENENGYAQTLFLEKCKNKDLTEKIEKLEKAKYIFATVDYCSDDLAAAIEENKRLAAENKKLTEENEHYRKMKQFFEYIGGSYSIMHRGKAFTVISDKLDQKIKERENAIRITTAVEMQSKLTEKIGRIPQHHFCYAGVEDCINKVTKEVMEGNDEKHI